MNLFLSALALVNKPSRFFVSVAPILCNNAATEGPDTIDTDNNHEPTAWELLIDYKFQLAGGRGTAHTWSGSGSSG